MAGAKVVKVWEEVVTGIEGFATDPTRRTDISCVDWDQAVLEGRVFVPLRAGQPGSKAIWNKFVQENKVPLRLGKACCQLLDISWPLAVYLTARCWYTLLTASSAAGVTPENDDASTCNNPRSSTALAIGKQLQQSGLLQRLPGIMTATAEQLQAAAGVAPAGGSAAAGAAAASLTPAEREKLDLTAELLRVVSTKLSLLWNQDDYYGQQGVAFIQPEGHLAMAGMQYLSTVMAQAQQLGSAPTLRHVTLLQCFFNFLHNSAASATMAQACGAPGFEHLLDLQPGRPNYVLQCACLATTIAALRGALPAELTAPASTGSNTSRSDEAEEVRRWSRLWQRCCRLALAGTVLEVCSMLLQSLGCSKEVVLWVAAREGVDAEIKRSVFMAQAAVQVACSLQMQNPNTQQPSDRPAAEAALQLFWQLPAVALLWASQHPTGTPELDAHYVRAANSAIKLSCTALCYSIRLQHSLRGYSVRPGAVQLIDEEGSRAPLPAVFLKVAQPLQCHVLTQLLQLQRASVAEAPSSLPAAIEFMPWTAVVERSSRYPKLPLTSVVDGAASNLHIMVQHTMRPDSGPSSRQHATARQLCPVFEDFLRGQAEALLASGRIPAGGMPHLFALVGLPGLLSGEMPGWQIGPLVDPITELAEPKALQLCGLLWSCLKFASNSRLRQLLEGFNPSVLFSGSIAARADGMGRPSAQLYASVACGATCQLLGDVLFSRGAAAINSQAATAMLPWLALLGHSSIFWGEELQSWLPGAAGQGLSSAAAGSSRSGAAAGASTSSRGLSACGMYVSDNKDAFLAMARLVESCLGSSSAAAQLSSVGYDLQPLLQQLQRMKAALLTAAAGVAGSTQQQALAGYQDLSSRLIALGDLLASLAHPYACNNPRCGVLSGPSEVRLVTGSSTKCGGCKTARYCSRRCLKQHWQQHKPVCKALAAAAADDSAGK